MKLVLRWFPYGDDSVKLDQIRQIPGVSGVATHLTKIPAGDVWTMDEINMVKNEINAHGLEMEVIESLNIHEDIKKGLPSRDMYIDNYIVSMKNLAEAGVKCIWTGTGAISCSPCRTAAQRWHITTTRQSS